MMGKTIFGLIKQASISAFILIFILLGIAQPTQAHGYIVRAIPQDRAVLERSPVRLQYWFSEALEPQFSKLTVRDEIGNIVDEGGVDEDNRSLLKVRLPTDLAEGAYFAELRTAFASDGHVIVETQVFFIGDAVAGARGTAGSDQAVPLEVIWRGLVLASTTMLLGAFSVYTLVLVPAWGNPKYRAGLLPPRVMRRLNWIVLISLVIALGANILALIQQTMVFFGADIANVIDDELWRVVQSGTTFGDMWSPRLLFLLIVGGLHAASIYFRNDQPKSVRAFWVANMWATILIVATWSASSHAAGSPLWPWIALANDWLHGLAVSFWAGGLITLVIILPVALQPYTSEQQRIVLLTVLRRFSRLAIVCVVLTIATGIYSALNWIYAPTMAISTYGGSLLLKIVLVVGLLLLGMVHHAALRPEKYARWQGMLQCGASFIPTLRLEAVYALIVISVVGLLSATPIPEPDISNETIDIPSGILSIGEYTVQLSLSPGGPGINTYDAVVWKNGKLIDDVKVYLQMINPNMDDRGEWHTLESFGDGLFSTAGDEIDVTGLWWTIVDIQDEVDVKRVAFEWNIINDASVDSFRDPLFINIVAMLGVLIAISVAFYSMFHRFYVQQLKPDLSITVVMISLIATFGTLGILIWGTQSVQQQMQRYESTLNPTPTKINPVLPDQTSLDVGQQVFQISCPDWQSDQLSSLLALLSKKRDEEIFNTLDTGWRDLIPCSEDIPIKDRWNLVNYIRTFEKRS